jgi:DNA-binding transcriptional ArsR family regulator
MEQRIILDDKSFKALSADSRVNILKKLRERRMTLSELSQRLMLKNSTVKEHCSILLNADLISKIDEGRKWKYYQLTGKGKQVVEPSLFEEAKVFVMLSFTAVLFAGIILFSLQGAGLNSQNLASSDKMMIASAPQSTLGEENYILDSSYNEITTERLTPLQEITNMDYFYFSIGIILTLVVGIFIGVFFGRRIN